jgi:hypothetical protein
MCTEASTILGAVAADFFFNCWYLEIPSDNRIRHIPSCVHYHAQGFPLEMNSLYVGKHYIHSRDSRYSDRLWDGLSEFNSRLGQGFPAGPT